VLDQKQITVSFSEDVMGADNRNNYIIRDSAGRQVGIGKITYDSANHKATLSFNELLQGSYTIAVKGITDSSPAQNMMEPAVQGVFIKDTTPPDYTQVRVIGIDLADTTDKDKIYVLY